MKKLIQRSAAGIFLLEVIGLTLTFGQSGRAPGDFMSLMHRSMASMRQGMERAPMTGNPDRDFAAMMIPHHQGAIEMAKAELLFGKDRALRRLAQQIIVDQQSEIDLMNLWLAKHPMPKTEGEKR